MVQVPDDPRDLARDAEALARERRAAERAARRGRLLRRLLSGQGASVGIPALAVLGVLAVVAVPAVLLLGLRPSFDEEQPARPLASPSAPPGQVGGLLPDVDLRTGLTGEDAVLPARESARPGALVLVPASCGCDALVDDVVAQVREFTRNVRLVLPRGAQEEAVRLRTDVLQGLARSSTDPSGALAAAYGPGVTVVAVGADGVVLDVLVDVQPEQRLEARLDVLRPR